MKKPDKETLIKWWKEWRVFLLFVLILFSFRSTIADWSHVPTGSMKPTLMEGDRILVDKLAYDLRFPFLHWRLKTWGDPERGDIVIFPSPETEELYVKRVIGLPGDSVAMKDNQLIINDKVLKYTFDDNNIADVLNQADQEAFVVVEEQLEGRPHSMMVSRHYRTSTSTFTKRIIPQGSYMVLGDNRDNSKDSRFIGFIDRERIRGRATKVIISLNSDEYWMPREGRYFQTLH
ncbi:MAG: signal peptidase I [Gammaproteobacteria bacterium]|nr:MAG: signal peptidase I [Gammaproteobacteria bacterium]